MQHDGWFFAGVFVFIFLVWFAVGGPTHPIAFSGPTLAQPGVLGGGTYLSLPTFSIGGKSNVSLPGSTPGGGSVSGSSVDVASELLNGVAFGTPSPYRGIVTLSHSVIHAGTTAAKERVELFVSSSATSSVDISGWTIESAASGSAVTIPRGTETPTSGTINAAQDIILQPGQRAYLITGQSPIGASFRTNKCIGYFANYQTFTPSLPNTCPAPSDELTSFYGPDYVRDTACVNYVNTINTCQTALTPPPTLSSACQNFLVTYLNYNGCVQAHQNDTDFAGNTWYIYLGGSSPMWRKSNEVVKLLDKSGKTVDGFSY